MKKKVSAEGAVVSDGETQVEIDKNLEELVQEFKELFQGIGKINLPPIHIHTREGMRPIAQKQRQVAHHYLAPLKQHLQELLEGDVIEGPLGSEKATGWMSNVVIGTKKYDPDSTESGIRMTLDMRHMADTVKAVHLPIPTSEQLRHKFQGSDRFSILDLNHAFHQLELDEDSKQLFAFTTPFGVYRYKRLVMGTPPASAECHSKLAKVWEGLEGIVQIKDDLVVHRKGKTHDVQLRHYFFELGTLV